MSDSSLVPPRTASVDEKRRLLSRLLAERRGERTTGPVSFAQQRLWVLDQLVPASGGYNVPIVFRTAVAPDPRALALALGEVVRRHQVLRTVFPAESASPVQRVLPPFVPVVEEWDLTSTAAPAEEAQRQLQEWTQQPFDLAKGPLLRACLVRVSETENLLALTVHHIVCDGWSLATLLAELDSLYLECRSGVPAGLAPLSAQYLDYADWQRTQLSGDRLHTLIDYWRRRLDGAPGMLQLPMDQPRPTGHRVDGGSQRTLLPDGTAAACQALATREGTTPFVLLLTCFVALMSRLSGQRDIVVGVPVAGQHRAEFEGLIGFFVNTLVMRVQSEEDPTLRELMAQTKEAVLGALAHQDMPFEKLVVELQPDRHPTVTPVFQVLFNYQVGSDQRVRLANLQADLVPFDSGIVRFDLELNLFARADAVGGSWVYNKQLFEPSVVARIRRLFEKLVAGAVATPDARLSSVALLDERDLDELRDVGGRHLEAAPATPPERAFTDWVRRIPDAVALRACDREPTYSELDAAVTSAAEALLRAGVVPGAPVVAPRDSGPLHTVIGLLAALRAGTTAADRAASPAPNLAPGPHEDWVTSPPTPGIRPDDLARQVAHRSSDLPLTAGESVLLAVPNADPDELLWPLASGATLTVVTGVDAVRDALAAAPVHTLRTSPGLLHQLLSAAQPPGSARIERILCSGEPLGCAVERRCRQLLHATELWTVFRAPGVGDVARRRCRADVPAGRDVSGHVVTGAVVRVLDANGGPQPLGVAGVVHVGRTDLPGHFPPDPLDAGHGGVRLLPTDRLGRFRDDGQLELLGGVSDQVYQRQVRVPRGEVEAVLTDSEHVFDARVDARVDPETGRLEVVAYVVLEPHAPSEPGHVAARMRAHCQRLLPAVLVPVRFVVLPLFPLAPDGTVDRCALVKSAAQAAESRKDVQPPRNSREAHDPVERTLSRIWCDVLGLSSVGVHDNFFGLGGHSLLAVHVMTQVRRSLGVDLPVSALFRYRTVSDLTARIADLRAGRSATGRALVPIQAGSAQPGLALVHPAGGSVFCYASLASALPSRSVWAFETRAPASSLVDQARGYLDELSSVESPQPCLAGWSLGGVVAFEIALQRIAAGAEAAPLVLVDSFLQQGDPAAPGTHRYLLDSFLRDLLADLDLGAPSLPPGAEVLPARRLLADVMEGLGDRAPAGMDLEEVLLRYEVYRRNMLNVTGYVPARPYPGEVHLIQAEASPEAAGAWRPFAPRLTVHRIDGDHYSIMRNPRITRIAWLIDNLLTGDVVSRHQDVAS